jgi:hypothetical protein
MLAMLLVSRSLNRVRQGDGCGNARAYSASRAEELSDVFVAPPIASAQDIVRPHDRARKRAFGI